MFNDMIDELLENTINKVFKCVVGVGLLVMLICIIL